MKVLTLALLLSLPVPRWTSPVKPALSPSAPQPRKGGTWHLAANGHAVFCYGPVMNVTQANGEIIRVATFCRGDLTMVPLKE